MGYMPHKFIREYLRSLAISRIRNAAKERHQENAKSCADRALCSLLEDLGFEDVVEEYNDLPNFYS